MHVSKGSSYVYFIHAPAVGLVKIGLAGHPMGRLTALQIGSPVDLYLVRAIEGGMELEQEFHRAFADRRVRGEWFEDSVLHAVLEQAPPFELRTPRIITHLEHEGQEVLVEGW